jgi:ComEC/Rec2-related protein
VGLLDIVSSNPRRFSLPVAAAVGFASGFYPTPIPTAPLLCAAVLAASFGSAARALGTRGAALNAARLVALGFGMAAGAFLGGASGGGADPGAPAPSAAPGSAFALARAPDALELRWAEGRLPTDSTPAKNGFRTYVLSAERLGLSGEGVEAELAFPTRTGRPSIRVLSSGGPELDSGCRLRARGFPGSGPGAALFAKARDVEALDRGGVLDRARSVARSACRAALARVGSVSAGLLEALILGVRDSLGPGEAEAFKAAGCSHILALSGEHLSVLAVVAVAALRPLVGPLRAGIGGAALATLFMWIAGAGPSLLRAVLTAWIAAIAALLDRPQPALVLLSISFLLMAPFDPEGARSMSFVLSYAAVWGLAVLGPRFTFLLGRALPPFLRGPASASLSAQAAVSPILALTFGYIQLAGIPASIVAGPLVTATMWWGMAAGTACSIVPAAARLAVPVSDFLYRALMAVMRAAASMPPIALPGAASRAAAVLAVVLIAAAVYARPHAEYRQALARLRFADRPPRLARGRGPRDVQALRPELPRQPPPAGAHTRGAPGRARHTGLGDRARDRVHDGPRPGSGPPGRGLRDRPRLRPPARADLRR